MAWMSRAVKETVQTIAVLVVALLLIVLYVIYPLNRTKAIMARPDIDSYHPDSIQPNDPGPLVALGLTVDTFRFEADGLTKLACARVVANRDSLTSDRGLAILLHREGADRASLADMAKQLADSGFEVILYDQRATGLSTGKYRSDGQLEAADLEAVVGYLEIQGRLKRPLIVVGWGAGADAAILAAADEPRINHVIAIDPYLSSGRFVQRVLKANNVMWLPFNETIFWWWYKIRSGYAVLNRTIDNLVPVRCRIIIAMPADRMNDAEITKLIEISPKELLIVGTVENVDVVRAVTVKQ